MRSHRAPIWSLPLALLAALALAAPAGAQELLAETAIDPVAIGDPGARFAAPPEQAPAFVPGEVIVRFRDGTSAADRRAARSAAGVGFERGIPIPRAQVVAVDGAVKAAARRLERHPDVAYAQPNYRYRALADPPDDTFFDELWGLEDTATPNPGVDALHAWDVTRGAGQVIAILDTGVALDHPDLAPNLWTGGLGGTHGDDFVDNDTDPDDYDFHGTHVAGTAAAVASNGLGIVGVAPEAEIMAVRVLDGNGSGTTDDIATGIEWAASNGADVINLSLGGPAGGAGDQLMSDAIAVADAEDVVVVAAAGNEASDNDANPTTPCTLANPNLLCVAAIGESGALADFSNFGQETVDVAAPGTNVLSTKTDYAEVFAEDFASGADWSTGTANGGLPWGLVGEPNSDGSSSAADSPTGNYGAAIDPDFYASSVLSKSSPLSLVGERGCRMGFDVRYELEYGFDALFAGAVPPDIENDPFITGSSGGAFHEVELSISNVDGSSDAMPQFTLLSDQTVQMDGVYVDDVRVVCRDDTYSNEIPPDGNYVRFDGTSMAAPHVAGVAALVGAAAPSAADTDIVHAIKAGVVALPSLECKVATGGAVSASAAIEAATAGSVAPIPVGCPPPPPPPPPPSAPAASPPPQPASPSVSLAGAKRKLRVSRRGVFRYVFTAADSTAGRIVFRTARKVRVARRRHLVVARKAFKVPTTGTVRVRVKLPRRKLRILRRNRRFVMRAIVKVRDASGQTATARKRLVLLAPRTRRRP